MKNFFFLILMFFAGTANAQFGDVSINIKQNFKDSTITMQWPYKVDSMYAVEYTYIQDQIQDGKFVGVKTWNTYLPFRTIKLYTERSVVLMYMRIWKKVDKDNPNKNVLLETVYSKTYDIYTRKNTYFEKGKNTDTSIPKLFFPEQAITKSRLTGNK